MRASRNGSFIFQNKHNKLIGINLGADYVAEHERGIKEIKLALGLNEEAKPGLPRKLVTKQSPLLIWIENKTIGKVKYSGFAMYRFWNSIEEWVPREFYSSDKDKTFFAGWASDGFYVLSESKSDQAKYLKQIFEALNSNNACIWQGGGGVFNNAGLCIGIVDQMPKEIFDGWAKADKDQVDLKKEFDATGIEKILRDAKKNWFYLGPKRNSEGKMIIWLNPYDQHIHHAGYFTVQQLKQWAHNTGPVMMSEAEKKARGRY